MPTLHLINGGGGGGYALYPEVICTYTCSLKIVVVIFTAYFLSDQEKVSDYEMKLIDLDTEHLGIPVSE